MKLKLKNTPEQVELIKAMGSKNALVAREASEAFAAFIGPVVSKVLTMAGTSGLIYSDSPYDEDDSPSYPLDLYYNEDADFISVWSQGVAGGLPTSHVEGLAEMKIATYRLDSGVSFLKKYARRARLDVISKAVERMAQEILLKQERNAWAVILKALAEANTNGLNHLVVGRDNSNSHFEPGDLSALMTKIKRINTSWGNNTPVGFDSKGLTDLFVSPEIMQEVRGFAYNPVNNLGSKTNGPVTVPDSVRESICSSAGMSEIYGVVLHELVEFGTSKRYNTLFDSFENGVLDGQFAGTPAEDWNASNHEVLVGLDLGRECFIRPVARQHDSNGTFSALPDDQWVTRSEKTGFYGFLEEGRVCIDSRAIVGLVV